MDFGLIYTTIAENSVHLHFHSLGCGHATSTHSFRSVSWSICDAANNVVNEDNE